MTAEVFIQQMLAPMMLVDLPKLYGKEAHKVVLHTRPHEKQSRIGQCVRTSASVRTSRVIKVVKQMTESDNPKSQRVIGLCAGVSQSVASRIISEDLGRIRKKKVKQRYLTDAMIEKRRFRAEEFAELVTPQKQGTS